MSRARIATAIRRGWMSEPHHGVLVVAGAAGGLEHRVMVEVSAVGGTGAASHRTAARLHRLDGFERTTTIELSVDRSHRWQFQPTDVVAHHIKSLDPVDLVTCDGIPTTSIPRTLADLGSVVRNPELVGRALTDARRRGIPLEVIRSTVERLHRPGQRGTGVLRRQLDAIPFEGSVPDSWFEEVLARCLDHPAIPRIVTQHPIRRPDGTVVARVDIAIPSVRLGIEAHSRKFHFGPRAERLDEQRDLAVAACGWELLYLGWHATKRPAEVVSIVAEVVRARRRTLVDAA